MPPDPLKNFESIIRMNQDSMVFLLEIIFLKKLRMEHT